MDALCAPTGTRPELPTWARDASQAGDKLGGRRQEFNQALGQTDFVPTGSVISLGPVQQQGLPQVCPVGAALRVEA